MSVVIQQHRQGFGCVCLSNSKCQSECTNDLAAEFHGLPPAAAKTGIGAENNKRRKKVLLGPVAADVTTLLAAWGEGDQAAFDRLVTIVHQELRRLAHCYMAGQRPGCTLESTALVNEAFLRLVNCGRVCWQDRTHFFAVSANLMRRVLVDYARSRNYQKRGAGIRPLALNEALDYPPETSSDLLPLDDCLNALAEFDPRKSRVVE